MNKELAKKNKDELIKEIETKTLALRDIRFGAAHSKSKNVKEVRTTKKEIARLKTALNQK